MKLPMPRRVLATVGLVCGAFLVLATACNPSNQPAPASNPTSAAPPTPAATPTSVPVAPPAPTVAPGQQQAGGMHSALPLQGEYAVTANQDDRSLTTVPIGAASVATTVQLDVAPGAIGAAPNSDTVFVGDSAASSHTLAIASLNTSSETGQLDVGGRA